MKKLLEANLQPPSKIYSHIELVLVLISWLYGVAVFKRPSVLACIIPVSQCSKIPRFICHRTPEPGFQCNHCNGGVHVICCRRLCRCFIKVRASIRILFLTRRHDQLCSSHSIRLQAFEITIDHADPDYVSHSG